MKLDFGGFLIHGEAHWIRSTNKVSLLLEKNLKNKVFAIIDLSTVFHKRNVTMSRMPVLELRLIDVGDYMTN